MISLPKRVGQVVVRKMCHLKVRLLKNYFPQPYPEVIIPYIGQIYNIYSSIVETMFCNHMAVLVYSLLLMFNGFQIRFFFKEVSQTKSRSFMKRRSQYEYCQKNPLTNFNHYCVFPEIESLSHF